MLLSCVMTLVCLYYRSCDSVTVRSSLSGGTDSPSPSTTECPFWKLLTPWEFVPTTKWVWELDPDATTDLNMVSI